MKIFAAINVGSFELSMKIFEMSAKRGVREIDHIRHRINLGTDTYTDGKVSHERMDELCRYLNEYMEIMKSYQVDDYRAYGTSAVREAENTIIMLDHIRQRTGINVEVLSNSEQRFLDYKSIAFKGEDFYHFIEKGAAIVDIGGGSIQLSLFDGDVLMATQNLRLGVLRIRETLHHVNAGRSRYEALIREMAEGQLSVFQRLYLKDRRIHNIILVDDYISAVFKKKLFTESMGNRLDVTTFEGIMQKSFARASGELTKTFDMPEEHIELLQISYDLLKQIMKMMHTEYLWAPGATLCDGIAYEYAQKQKMIRAGHDFEEDIVTCARNISKRYMGSKKQRGATEQTALALFQVMKKDHGMGSRERLLLMIAAILHDCGKYISMSNMGECSYRIIMATEMIGLSHEEREMIARVARYCHLDFEYYDEKGTWDSLDREAYLKVAKLTAILRLACGFEGIRNQGQREIKAVCKDHLLTITVQSEEDLTLVREEFRSRAVFFEEVFSIKPVMKQRRGLV